MAALRPFRLSIAAVLALCLVVALASCSKKDVITDEPAINPSGTAGAPSSGTTETEPIGSAGDAGHPAGELATIFFPFDSAALSGQAKTDLKNNAAWLKKNSTASVQIEGHCDERGTNEYNLALGQRRAEAVQRYMRNLGIEKSRLSVISYGEERPLDPGHDEAAWAKNRRAEFVITGK